MAVSGTFTGVLTFTAAADTATGPFIMDSCRWIGGTTAGHNCHAEDLKGNNFFTGEANGANYTDGWAFDHKWVDGIYIASLGSGTFQVYLARK